ncbi:MAG: glutamate 5-kinase [Ruminococcus sp.]|nr:glutamate 5-kinase [Ruminococcus sp.]
MSKISEKKRVVFKIGTSTLTHRTGMVNIRRIENLVKVLADVKNQGHEIIIVTSGAIGLGCGKLGLKERPTDTPSKQAAAAVGQCQLMYMYDKYFAEYNMTVAQMLLTKYIIEPIRRQNVINTLTRLLDLGAIPIINENDTVAIDELELEVGENDSLAAIVGEIAEADLLVILSDIDGLYSEDPRKNPDAVLIHEVDEITDEIRALAGGAGTANGTGGMITKLNAAEIANGAGIDMVIMNGKNPMKIYDLFEDKPIGTIFRAKKV